MDWLNYHHLLYFWTVAREGSIVRASEKLRLAQPTISGQIRKLEESLEVELFERVGRFDWWSVSLMCCRSWLHTA